MAVTTKEELMAQLEAAYKLKCVPLDPEQPDGLQLQPLSLAQCRTHFLWVEQQPTKGPAFVEEASARLYIASVTMPDGTPIYSESDIPTVRKFEPSHLTEVCDRIIQINGFNKEAS